MGRYSLLIQNIVSKTSWGSVYGIKSTDEQISLVFTVLLYLMEMSLRDENCTLDDIAGFLSVLDDVYLGNGWSYDTCRDLADFIVNTIICNEGRIMTFAARDYEEGSIRELTIRYVNNRAVDERNVRRTSYYLTEDGYILLLSTLEIESNMRLKVQELLFQMQLERQDYDKALEYVKGIFNEMRLQIHKVQEAMVKLRRNVLDYSVAEHEQLLKENLDVIADSSERLEGYRTEVQTKRRELKEIEVNLRELNEEERKKLKNLGAISEYLSRSLDEFQRIRNHHFKLKDLYAAELDNSFLISAVKRFSLRDKIYEEVLKQPALLGELHTFLSPLFRQDPEKIYDPARSTQLQRPVRGRREEEAETIDFDEAAWEEEQERLREEKRARYHACLNGILAPVVAEGEVRLSELCARAASEEDYRRALIPTVDTFKEVMVELIRSRELDIRALRQERRESLADTGEGFEVGAMILEVLDQLPDGRQIRQLIVERISEDTVVFEGIEEALPYPHLRTIRCSEVRVRGMKDGI
ncbi:MAG: hypothetical protein IJT34_07090 [Butyrivibrio sp.]|nr:hypothetical protein [Butyrivibrio sp.]